MDRWMDGWMEGGREGGRVVHGLQLEGLSAQTLLQDP